jgi:hypothetical protein
MDGQLRRVLRPWGNAARPLSRRHLAPDHVLERLDGNRTHRPVAGDGVDPPHRGSHHVPACFTNSIFSNFGLRMCAEDFDALNLIGENAWEALTGTG